MESTFNSENSPPVFDNLNLTMQFTFTKNDNSTSKPFVIELGAVSDPDGDLYSIEFEN